MLILAGVVSFWVAACLSMFQVLLQKQKKEKNNKKTMRLGVDSFNDDVVVMRIGQKRGDPCVITVNCPDKLGLACDLSRIVFEFGLRVVRGDFSTDGKWCFVIFWVVPNQGAESPTRWAALKKRLLTVCPPCNTYLYCKVNSEPAEREVYLLRLCLPDRVGSLNDTVQLLWEMDLIVHKAKIWTKPDGTIMNLFYITDNRELLHTKNRQEDVCHHLRKNLGQFCTHCELWLRGPEFGGLDFTPTSLSPSTVENMLTFYLPNVSDIETDADRQMKSKNVEEKLDKISVTVDNSLSPSHTLLQISCQEGRSLIYDITRVLKDSQLQLSYARFSRNEKGMMDGDLFVSHANGTKMTDAALQVKLCDRLKMEIAHPVRVLITGRGPDTELVVASPIDSSAQGRPRVIYDATTVLKILGINIFMASVERNLIDDRKWEVYRFLLADHREWALGSTVIRNQIAESMRRMLTA